MTSFIDKKPRKKSKEYQIPEDNFDVLNDSGGNPTNEYYRHKSTILFEGSALNK